MPLSTNGPIGTAEIEEICRLRDDVYRNRWITFAYWKISERLRGLIGDNASWCTFSTWSSRTIGESLRLDKATRRIEELVDDEETSTTGDHPWLLRLQYRVITRDHGAAQLALAIGNRDIFREIGSAVTQLLEWVEGNPYNPSAWQNYRQNAVIPFDANLLFPMPASGAQQLWSGLDCYYAATDENDADTKAELVLQGNILLGAYEQERADRLLKVALEPFPGQYVRIVRAGANVANTLSLKVETSWALRGAWSPFRVISEQFGGLMTRYVMALDAPLFSWPIRPLRLGDGIPRPANGSPYPPALATLDDRDLSTLFGEYDRSGGTPDGCAARNWTQFPDRMKFIVNLFRAGQQDRNLYRPLPVADLRTLNLDLSDAHLNKLRKKGDKEVDHWIRPHVAKRADPDPRHYVDDLVADGFEDLLAAKPPPPEAKLPDWADRSKLWAGQKFFRTFGLEIGAALFSASLPISYTAAHGARVLTTTAALVSDPRRRLAETGQMLLDAMASDDSSKPPLDPDTRAFEAARGVRLFHGAVRHMLSTDPTVNWHETRLGVPINQEDLVGTLAVFTVAVIESLDEMGVTVSVRDRDNYFHLWLVMGHLLGIDYDRLFRNAPPSTEQPLTYADMQLIARVIFARHQQASPGGRTLMSALLNVTESSMPPFLKGVPRALTRRLIGNDEADMLGVPSAGPMRVFTAALRPVNAIVSPYLRSNPLGALNGALTRRLYRWWIDEGHGNRPPWRFDEVRPPWLDSAPTRVRRRAGGVVDRLPVVPAPAKARLAGFVRPD